MKNFIKTVLVCFFAVGAFATENRANDFEIYSEDELLFSLYVNDVLLDTEMNTRYKMENVAFDKLSIRIIFDNPAIPAIEKKVWISLPGNIREKKPMNSVFKIVKKRKKFKVKNVSRSYKIFHQEDAIEYYPV